MGSLSLKRVLCCAGEEAKDPCLPVGYSRAAPAGTVVGSGNFEECRAIAKGLIAGQCQDDLCPIGDSMPVELQGTQLALTPCKSACAAVAVLLACLSSAQGILLDAVLTGTHVLS